ncbi:MAG: peptidoglycan-binding protein [Patescibacteria group bacterium]
MKKAIAVLALCAVAVPALAQTYPYGYGVSSTATVSAPAVYCPQFSYNLYIGLSDYYTRGQVTQLQQFLSTQGYYQPITGYFGSMTRANVAQFQRAQSVYPITGGVGPLTRAAIARTCGGVVVPPQPTGGVSITGISGPNSLAVGQSGTWQVTTSALQGSYVSISVRWGDELQYPYATGSAAQSSYIAQQNTFTHSYQSAGTYTITFTATDQYGRSTTGTASVLVTGGTQQQGLSVNPSSGAAPLTVTITPGQYPTGYWAVQFGDGQTQYMLQGSVTHTYTQPGTHTVTATSDMACLHTTPQCYTFAAQQILGTATVVVTSGQVVGAMIVSSPVQGQQVQNGTSLAINWGAPYLVTSGSYVLDLYTAAGAKVGTIAIQSATQSSGSYSWNVPRIPINYMCAMIYPNGLCGQNLVGGSYYVQVSLVPGNGFDNQQPTATAKSGVFTVY